MTNVLITDNFLDEDSYQYLYKLVEPAGEGERMFFVPSRKVGERGQQIGNIQFVHNLMTMGTRNILNQTLITQKLNALSWVKAKINFTLGEANVAPAGWHKDVYASHAPIRTGILYLNTNNGYTELEDGTKVESVANRYVEFDADTEHRGVNCTDVGWRCLLNLNYLPSEDSPIFKV